ncbi:MAG: hypothetical protein ACRD68_07715, partial [Pyrinomonadaceae bacterium]
DWLIEGMRSGLGVEEWARQLREYGDLLVLGLEISRDNAGAAEVVSQKDYVEALAGFAREVAGRRLDPPVLDTNLAGLLVGEARKELRRKLYEAFHEHAGDDIPAVFFEMFGAEMADSGTILSHEKETVDIVRALLTGGRDAGLRWFADVLRANPALTERGLSPKAVGEIETEVAAARRRNPDDKTVAEIANSLRINNPDELAESYEQIIRTLASVSIPPKKLVTAFRAMQTTGSYFSIPIEGDSFVERANTALRQVSTVKVKDEERLRSLLNGALENVKVDLESKVKEGETPAPSEQTT